MKYLVVLAAVVLGLAACSSRSAPVSVAAVTPASVSAPEAAAKAAGAPPRAAAAAATHERKVIRTATLVLTSKQPRQVLALATQLTNKYGGFVTSSEALADNGTLRSVELSLRVPSDHFEAAVAEISGLGALQRQQLTGTDVTEEYVDLEARAQSKRILQARLREIAGNAGSMSDLLTVESEINRHQTELDNISGRTRFLETHSELASIQLTAALPELAKPAPAEPGFGERMLNAVAQGSEGFTDVAEGLVVMTMTLLPMLPLAAALWFALRVFRRQRRERVAG